MDGGGWKTAGKMRSSSSSEKVISPPAVYVVYWAPNVRGQFSFFAGRSFTHERIVHEKERDHA